MSRGRWIPAIAAVLLLTGCMTSSPSGNRGPIVTMGSQNVCDVNPQGQQGPNGNPIVCIDYQAFSGSAYQPSPDPVQANRSIVVQFWFYNIPEGANPELDIQFTADTPIHHRSCQGDHCIAQVMPNAGHHIQKKYTIIDRTTGQQKDPDILIEP